MENKDNNLDETKVFKAIDDKDEIKNDSNEDTLHIPTFNKPKEDLEETIVINAEEVEEVLLAEELIDNSQENLKAAEEELNKVLAQQNGDGDGDDDLDMAKKKKMDPVKKVNIILSIVTVIMIIGFISAGSLWMYLNRNLPDLDINALDNKNATKLLDANGDEFFDFGKYTNAAGEVFGDMEYIDMSQNVIDAFVSIEDSRFFKHKGFDLSRFTKAMIINVKDTIRLRQLSFSQGGSTLTMQLLKTSQFSADKELERKAMEITLALELDGLLSKDQIFEYYVNKINYGAGNTRGLDNAAQYYFGKSASELNISEAALLAGVVNQPNSYSPINNLDKAYERRNDVINLMERHGYIDAEEARLAKAIKIENQLTDDSMDTIINDTNPYIDYANAVVKEVKEKLDIDILTTPVVVKTNMDPAIQEDISKIQNEETYTYPDDTMQSGVAIIDNDTGAVLGLGGGRQNSAFLGFNRATDMYQQPGSVTKPLLSFALAFEHLGYSTSHVVEDKPVQYKGTDKILGNANGRYQGQVRLKDAVANSLNTPAYLTLLEVEAEIGQNAVATYLRDSLGFSQVKSPAEGGYNTQYAIGGSTFEISPLELAAAQAVMMNGGYYIAPQTVQSVETMDNIVMKDEFESTKTRVISEETAYLVSVLEEYNVSSGIFNRMEVLRNKPYKVYAKTGTTDYGDHKWGPEYGIPKGAGKDQWMYASSRKYTSVVWMGFDKPEIGKQSYWTGPKYNANPLGKMQLQLLDSAHRGKEHPGQVQRPAGVSDITHVLATFPYANPIGDMDSAYITTGEINRKFLKLVDLNTANVSLESLSSFKAEINAENNKRNLTINWEEYPEDGAVAGSTYDISLGAVKATGTRLFHPSWIFGPIKYEAKVFVDNKEIDHIKSEENTFTKAYEIPNGAKVRVCGYYANNSQTGAETCVDVTNPDVLEIITIPALQTKADIDKFIKDNKLSNKLFVVGVPTPTSDPSLDGTIASAIYNNADVRGQAFKEDSFERMEIKVSYYQYSKPEVIPPEEENKPPSSEGNPNN